MLCINSRKDYPIIPLAALMKNIFIKVESRSIFSVYIQ